MKEYSWLFWFGVGLLVVNPILGLGGAAVCSYLALKTGKKRFYGLLGGIIYAISWVMLLLGGYISSSEGYVLVKDLFIKLLRIIK